MAHSLRYPAVIVFMVLVAHASDIRRAATGRMGRDRDASVDSRVVLIVADGLRWQEVFRGADSALLFSPAAGTRNDALRRYWRPGIAERRAALMPFLWNTVAREGQLYGNRDVGSAVRVTNPMKFSYPGYNELLTGTADPRIDSNDFGPNPNVTVFEWLHGLAEFQGRVAVAGTWNTFRDIFNVGRSRLPVIVPGTDAGTHAAALHVLRKQRPRALFVGYGETDDYAHKARYDATLDAAHAIDGYVAAIWSFVQSTPEYRGRTTLILVADHGRGRTPRDWMDHGSDVPGSDESWFAIIGPGVTALGEQRDGPHATLAQAAASVAAAVDLDYRSAMPRAARPLPPLLERLRSGAALSTR